MDVTDPTTEVALANVLANSTPAEADALDAFIQELDAESLAPAQDALVLIGGNESDLQIVLAALRADGERAIGDTAYNALTDKQKEIYEAMLELPAADRIALATLLEQTMEDHPDAGLEAMTDLIVSLNGDELLALKATFESGEIEDVAEVVFTVLHETTNYHVTTVHHGGGNYTTVYHTAISHTTVDTTTTTADTTTVLTTSIEPQEAVEDLLDVTDPTTEVALATVLANSTPAEADALDAFIQELDAESLAPAQDALVLIGGNESDLQIVLAALRADGERAIGDTAYNALTDKQKEIYEAMLELPAADRIALATLLEQTMEDHPDAGLEAMTDLIVSLNGDELLALKATFESGEIEDVAEVVFTVLHETTNYHVTTVHHGGGNYTTIYHTTTAHH